MEYSNACGAQLTRFRLGQGGFVMIALQSIGAGRRAMSQVKGLRLAVFRALAVNFAFVIVLAFSMHWLVDHFLLEPAMNWVDAVSPAWVATGGRVVKWILQFIIAAVLLVLALNLSLAFMGFWYENLVDRVVGHFRQRENRPFSFKSFVVTQADSIWVAIQDVVMAIFLLPLGFIPLVGFLIVFLGAAFLTGRSVVAAYGVFALQEGERLSRWVRARGSRALALGWVIGLVAFIPILGWFLAPWLLIYQVVGWAYLQEHATAQTQLEQGRT